MAGSASGCWWLTATLLKTQTSFAWSSAAQVVNSTTQVPWCLSMTPWCAASRCWSLWRRSENSIARSQTDLPVKDLTWCFYKLLPSAPRHAQAYMWHMHAKEASTSGKGWAFSIFVIIYQICSFGVVYGGISYLSRSEAVSSYSQALARIDLTPKLPTHLYLAFASLRPWRWLRLHCAQLSTLIRPKPHSQFTWRVWKVFRAGRLVGWPHEWFLPGFGSMTDISWAGLHNLGQEVHVTPSKNLESRPPLSVIRFKTDNTG